MESNRGYYALIQFSARPDRMEFVNIGVLLVVPDQSFVGIRFSEGLGRVERLFGKQQKSYLDVLKQGFSRRVESLLSRDPRLKNFEAFAEKRANELRLSKPMPIAVDNASLLMAGLFDDLVGEDAAQPREPRVGRRLREAFEKAGVVHYLDARPEVDLPEYGLKVSVPFGYQNGVYNLIDAMRVPRNVSEGLREAGKRTMEGSLVWNHSRDKASQQRLVVVGDFRQQSNEFYHAVQEQMQQANVKLHRLDDIRPLINDIEINARLHP